MAVGGTPRKFIRISELKIMQKDRPPKITVLMPVFNAEHDLHDAIVSILRQSFEDFEFLIIDDGSKDRSVEIISSFKDPRIRLERNEINLGLVATLNKGLHIARGAYIARMDADDFSDSNRFTEQIQLLEEYGADIVGCHFDVIDRCGNFLRNIQVPITPEAFTVCLANTVPFAHGSVMIRKSFLVENNLAYGPGLYSEDYDLWMRMYEKGAIFKNCDSTLFRYRDYGSSLSKVKLRQYLNSSEFLRRKFVTNHSEACQLAIDKLLQKGDLNAATQVNIVALACRLLIKSDSLRIAYKVLLKVSLRSTFHGFARIMRACLTYQA